MKVDKQTIERIASAQSVLVVCHVSPDGDAIGSLLGLGLALERIQKRVSLICPDPVSEEYHHLPGWERIRGPLADRERPLCQAALLISVDCSSLDRMGEAYDAGWMAGMPIVNIDHHPTNTYFGDANWVEPAAAATAQMLLHLSEALCVPLCVDIATCLLHGLLSDTQGFRTSNTTPDVLKAATRLIEAGAPFAHLTDRIFNHRPLGLIHMWARALERLTLEDRILCSEITQGMRRDAGYDRNGDAGLVNFMNSANEADIAVLFSELEDGQIDVSIRSAVGYDVSRVAFQLGGGGHAQAAGCTLPGPLGDAKARVLPLLHQAWADQTVRQ
jgi:phosphoesterase RecJ-like protein